MRILFVSSEVFPFSKTGGLADVAGALPESLRADGHDVLTVTALYDSIDRSALVRNDDQGMVMVAGSHYHFDIWEHPSSSTVFIDNPAVFGRGAIYTGDWDEHQRFAVLSHAALALVSDREWRPDVIHANDWQTGLIPALVRGPYAHDPMIAGVPTVLTIHNLAYQGRFGSHTASELGLGEHQYLLHHDHLVEGYLSFLETGLLHADKITTVSPTYAREIQTHEGGAGLDWLLRERSSDVVGILNGIDVSEWNPRTDPHIPYHFSEKSLWRKEKNKEALLERVGLPYRKNVPVIGVITRLALQKGIDIMPGPLTHFLSAWDLRLVVVGSGEPQYEEFFDRLAATHPDRVAFVKGYDNPLSHLIEAGSDIFLMPSLYEPCGLNQMYSLAYGTVPVVRRVGGLADIVEQADASTGSGTGVVFDHYSEDALGWAIGRALSMHIDRKGWQMIQRNGMSIDNSWEHRAREYEALYASLVTDSQESAE